MNVRVILSSWYRSRRVVEREVLNRDKLPVNSGNRKGRDAGKRSVLERGPMSAEWLMESTSVHERVLPLPPS
jgi:hypothetical protein